MGNDGVCDFVNSFDSPLIPRVRELQRQAAYKILVAALEELKKAFPKMQVLEIKDTSDDEFIVYCAYIKVNGRTYKLEVNEEDSFRPLMFRAVEEL